MIFFSGCEKSASIMSYRSCALQCKVRLFCSAITQACPNLAMCFSMHITKYDLARMRPNCTQQPSGTYGGMSADVRLTGLSLLDISLSNSYSASSSHYLYTMELRPSFCESALYLEDREVIYGALTLASWPHSNDSSELFLMPHILYGRQCPPSKKLWRLQVLSSSV
jgi:hypothetical protein